MGRRWQGVCALETVQCNVGRSKRSAVRRHWAGGGESCHDGRVHPSTGGPAPPGDRLQTGKTWNLGRPPSSVSFT